MRSIEINGDVAVCGSKGLLGWIRRSLVSVILAVVLLPHPTALAQTPAQKAINWLGYRQTLNGSWGIVPELAPRDTARAVSAFRRAGVDDSRSRNGIAWLATQSNLTPNQFLAEQAIALHLFGLNNRAQLTALDAQGSWMGPGLGGFSGYAATTWDSALALQAFATDEQAHTASIGAIVTNLLESQNPDGGWGLDRSFTSHPILTAEVLSAISTLETVHPPVTAVAAAQAYLVGQLGANGSIGGGPLETAVSFRALALSGYNVASLSPRPIAYLQSVQIADGSWMSDVFVTARVLEAFAVDLPNLSISSGDFSLSPSIVADGDTYTAQVKVRNIGTFSSPASTVRIYRDGLDGQLLGSASVATLASGASADVNISIRASGTGPQTIVAMADADRAVTETVESDNTLATVLSVAGKPDLAVFSTSISTVPARPSPDAVATVTGTVSNQGGSTAEAVAYRVYAGRDGGQLAAQGVIEAVPAGESRLLSEPVTLGAGSNLLRIVVDPDGAIQESREDNNSAARLVTAGALTDSDLVIEALTATPSRPTAGEIVTLQLHVANRGRDAVSADVSLFDGLAFSGIHVATLPIQLAGDSETTLTTTFTARASSRIVTAYADPANAVAEAFETNNEAQVALTDAYVDLAIEGDGLVLPRTGISAGQNINGRVVVWNHGGAPAENASVEVYDDLVSGGGVRVLQTTATIPAGGRVVLPVQFVARAGQRFMTAIVNGSRSILEASYDNNESFKGYVATGSNSDIRINITSQVSRVQAIDTTALVIDNESLRVSGTLKLNVAGNAASNYSILLFEDRDGDGMFHPERDNVLGSALGRAGLDPQYVLIEAAGSVQFAPGRLFLHLDSSNVNSETNESNNLVEVLQDCATPSKTFAPVVKWTSGEQMRGLAATGRFVDTNGDGVRDENDQPVVVYATGEEVIARLGSDGAILWRRLLGEGVQGSYMMPAVGDVDRNGTVEVIVHVPTHRLAAVSMETGETEWTSPELYRVADWDRTNGRYRYVGGPAIADLDGDGTIEVISGRTVLRGADGSVKWVGTAGQGRAWNRAGGDLEYVNGFPDQEISIAADVDGDGKLEVVAGNTAYRPDGTILWQRGDLPDGYTAALYSGTETRARICLVAEGSVYLLGGDGSTIWGPVAIPGGAILGGAPTVFMDGTSGPFIGVAGDFNYSVLRASDGGLVWTQRVSEVLNPTISSATAFDFGAGIALAFQSSTQFAILNGKTGAFLYTDARPAYSYYPGQPVVADLDGDGHAEVIEPGYTDVATTMRVLGDVTWNGATSVYNEAAFHVSNISEAGDVPVPETQSAFSRGHYRATPSIASATSALPNVSASLLRVNMARYPQVVQITMRIGNAGSAFVGPGLPVAVYKKLTSGRALLTVIRTPRALRAGEMIDVGFDWSDPGSGSLEVYAVANDDGTAIPTSSNPEPLKVSVLECNTGDNRTSNFSLALKTDVAAIPGSLNASDGYPRPGDPVHFSARAELFGGVDTTSLRAQFYVGNPSAGGVAISPLVPVTVEEIYRGGRLALAVYDWQAAGNQGPIEVFAVFDPAGQQEESDETNNALSTAITLSSSDIRKEIAGTFVLGPASAEPGQSIAVSALVQNTGNVALGGFTARYEVRSGAGNVVATGSSAVGGLAKGNQAWVSFDAFTPTVSDTYAIRLLVSDPELESRVPDAALRVAPFVGGMLSAAPLEVPTSDPLAQLRADIQQLNDAVLTPDPLRSSVIAALNRATAFETSTGYNLNAAQPPAIVDLEIAIVGLASASRTEGVTVSSSAIDTFVQTMLTARHRNGTITPPSWGPRGTTVMAAWVLTFVSGETAPRELAPALDYLVGQQAADGSYSDDWAPSYVYGTQEELTGMAAKAFARGYTLTGKEQYAQVLSRATAWLLARDYRSGINATPERAARIALGLRNALEGIDDPTFEASIRSRIGEIAAAILAEQNPDGTFGGATSPLLPAIRTAQCLEALLAAGYAPDEPHARASLLWLLRTQDPNGGWWENLVNPYPTGQLEESTAAMMALATAEHAAGQLDARLSIELPQHVTLEWSNSPSFVSTQSEAGNKYSWPISEVSEMGSELLANVRFASIADGESRPVALAATLSYANPYTGERVERPLAVPTVTGRSPLNVSVQTDRAAYQANDIVNITETITNLGADPAVITNAVRVVDANGTAVATVVSGESIADLPRLSAPGWHYKVPVSIPVETSREGVVAMDFTTILASLGVAGPIEPDSIRVVARGSSREEWPFSYYPSPTTSDVGRLVVAIPATLPVGARAEADVYFDLHSNGPKPVSTFARAFGDGLGLTATYWGFTSSNIYNILTPAQLTKSTPPLAVKNQRSTTMGTIPPEVIAVTWAWMTEWVGELYVPATGSYGFSVDANDAGWLYVDDVMVVDNHTWGNAIGYGQATLTAGVHRFKVVGYKTSCCHYGLSYGWRPPGAAGYGAIPVENLRVAVTPTAGASLGQATPADVSLVRQYTWPTGSTAAGQYSMTAVLDRAGSEQARSQSNFVIGGSTSVTATLTTDQVAYEPGSVVSLAAMVSAQSGNTSLDDLAARIRVSSPDRATVFETVQPIGTLVPGQTITVGAEWPTGSNPAGSYLAHVTIETAAHVVIAEASAPFEVKSSSTTGSGLTGTLRATPASVVRGATMQFGVEVTNGGNEALANAPFAIRILEATGATLVAELPLGLSAPTGATVTAQPGLSTAALPEGNYTAFLTSLVGGTPRSLATASFQVAAPPDAALTGTLAAPAMIRFGNAIDFGVTLTNAGSTALDNGGFEVRITDPASGSQLATIPFVATVAAGGSRSTSLSLTSSGLGVGLRTATLVSLASMKQLASASFEIAYRPDHFLTATVSVAPTATTGTPVEVSLSVTNGGTTNVDGASFVIRVTDASGVVAYTQNLSAAIAAGATWSTSLSVATSGLAVGGYSVSLISTMEEPEKLLGSASFTLVEPADAHLTGMVSAAPTVYFEDDAIFHVELANVGGATLENGALELRINDTSTGASLATISFTATVTDANAFATDLTIAASAIGTGNRTATLVSLTSTRTLATANVEVAYRPDHFLTATMSSAANPTLGEPLSFQVTISNGGTTEVSGGSFAVRLTSASGSAVAIANVTATIAAGGTYATDVTIPTTDLTAGVYSASFVSLLATPEKQLATTILTLVEPADAHVSGSVATEPTVYFGDYATLRASLTNSGTTTVTNGSFEIRITDASSGTQLAVIPFTASIAAGDSFLEDFAQATNTIGAGGRVATLVSLASQKVLSTTQFEIRFRPDHFLTGTLTVPSPVIAGDAVVMTATVHNGGSAQVSGNFELHLQGSTSATVVNLPFTANIAPGDTYSTILDTSSSTLETGNYTVTLVSTMAEPELSLAVAALEIVERKAAVIVGTIEVPTTASVGDTISIEADLRNDGSGAATDAQFSVVIRTAAGAIVSELPFTRSITAGGSTSVDLQLQTNGFAAGTYTATLSILGADAHTLDTRSFALVASTVSVDLGAAAAPRVLLWADCRTGNNTKPCTPTAPARIKALLQSAGIPFALVGTETEFLRGVRSGSYTEALIYQLGSAEVKHSAEYLAAVRGGLGLVYIGNRTSANPKLDPALGVSFRGKLQGPVTIQLLETPLSQPGTLVLQGDGVAIDLTSARSAGVVMATQAAAIGYSAYGSGKVVVLPFDTELTSGADELVLSAVKFVAKEPADVLTANEVVPVAIDVTNTSPSPAEVTVTATLTPGGTVVDASPAAQSSDPTTWNITVSGDSTKRLLLWVRMPDQAGTVRLTVTVSGASTPVTTSLDLVVSRDASSLANELRLTLETLLTTASAIDAPLLTDARTRVMWVAGLSSPDAATIEAVVQQLLTVERNLEAVSMDTTLARSQADRLLVYWQTRSRL